MGHEVLGRSDRGQIDGALDPFFHAAHVFAQHAQAPEHVGAGGGEFPARLGQEDAFPDLLDQGQADALLEALHLDRDGGLGKVQFFGGPREAHGFRKAREDAQLVQGDVSQFHGSIIYPSLSKSC